MITRSILSRSCAAQHFGAWCVETQWAQQALEAIKSGKWTPAPLREPAAADLDDDDDSQSSDGYIVKNGVAIICIEGQMTRYGSSYGGCSTIEVRRAVRAAKNDAMVRQIMLVVDSPGGTCAGTSDLADDVAAAAKIKPLYAYVSNLGASAAYWVASQANRIWANRSAIVGSIGTFSVLVDDTAQNEQFGLKLTVVSSAPFKGLGGDGVVSDALISETQRQINDLNELFLSAVSTGRGFNAERLAAVSDGRVYVGQKAADEGLVDNIGSLDDAFAALQSEPTKVKTQRASFAPSSSVMSKTNSEAAAAALPEVSVPAEPKTTAAAAPAAEAVASDPQPQPAPSESRTEFKRFLSAFGAEQGSKYFDAELSFDAALQEHVKHQASQLVKKEEEIAELKTRLNAAAASLGAPKPVPAAAEQGERKKLVKWKK